MEKYIKINIIKVKQNIGSFFIGKLTPKILHLISNKKLSRIQDPVFGIQRDPKNFKINEIKEYIKSKDATFPNNIIIAIQNDPLEEEQSYILNDEGDSIQIKLEDGIANILDGQHRVNGFDKNNEEFELPVAIFLDLSLGEQAKIFAKINSTQTKVDLTLVYDLFGITEDRTPEKVAFHLVEHLNTEADSAWKGKIKTLTDKKGDLAQGSMAKFFHKELLEKNFIFKKLYFEGKDTDIKNILMNYFNAIAKVFIEEWENREKKYILTKTTGFNGFMLFFLDLIKLANDKDEPLSTNFFEKYLVNAKPNFLLLNSINYPTGVVGQNKIRDVLRNTFSPEEKNLLNIK